jgi:hypothetical protein
VSAARDMLEFVDQFEPGARAKVLATFPEKSLEAYQSSPRTSWLPIEHDRYVVDGICEVFGTERAVQCWKASMPHMVDKPLLRTFVSGMIRIFGGDAARVVGVFPKGWSLVFSDFCDCRVETGPGERLAIILDDCAPQLRKYPNYFHSFNGIIQGFAQVCRFEGHVMFTVAKDFRRAEAVFVPE